MDYKIQQIGIIGAGELGSAIGTALTKTHRQVVYYDVDTSLTTVASIEELVQSCQILLLCVPSWVIKDVTKSISKAASKNDPKVVISFAKGVEPGFVTMDKILHTRLPDYYVKGLLYGPMIASEIDHHRPALGVLTLSSTRWYAELRHMFAAANIYTQMSGDSAGVAICAPLKNIYAIGFGILDGLKLGFNAKGALAVMVVAEMKRLVGDLGGKPRTAEQMAGLGDLLATGYSDVSFNYRVGKSLAEGIAHERLKSEGLVALHELGRKIGLKRLAQYPVVHAIDAIVFRYGEPNLLRDLVVNGQ